MDHRLVMLLLFLAYFAPSIVANVRHVRNVGSVVVVNLFLGWTFIGWVVALAMACGGTQLRQFRASGGYVVDGDQHHYFPPSPPPPPPMLFSVPPPPPLAPAGWYPDPSGKGARYWTGTQWSDLSPRLDLDRGGEG